MQQLLDDGGAHLVELVAAGGIEPQVAHGAIDLGRAHSGRPLDDRLDCGGGAAALQPGGVAVGGVRDDRAHVPGRLLTALQVGRRHALQVVQVEHAHVGELPDARVDVARHGHVDEGAGGHADRARALDQRRVDEEAGRAARRDHEVRGRDRVGQAIEGGHRGAQVLGQALGALARAAGDGEVLDAAVAQGARRQHPGRAGPHDERAAVGQRRHVLPREIDGGAADGDGVAADRRLRARALAGAQGVVQKPRERRVERPRLGGGAQRLAHLAQDLALAQHLGIDAGGDAEQVPRDLCALQAVVGGQVAGERQSLEVGELLHQLAGRRLARALARVHVDLGAVAGGEHDAVAVPLAVALQQLRDFVALQRDPLALVEPGRAMADPGGDQHAPDPPPATTAPRSTP